MQKLKKIFITGLATVMMLGMTLTANASGYDVGHYDHPGDHNYTLVSAHGGYCEHGHMLFIYKCTKYGCGSTTAACTVWGCRYSI